MFIIFPRVALNLSFVQPTLQPTILLCVIMSVYHKTQIIFTKQRILVSQPQINCDYFLNITFTDDLHLKESPNIKKNIFSVHTTNSQLSEFFSDNWLFWTCSLNFFQPRHVLILEFQVFDKLVSLVAQLVT